MKIMKRRLIIMLCWLVVIGTINGVDYYKQRKEEKLKRAKRVARWDYIETTFVD